MYTKNFPLVLLITALTACGGKAATSVSNVVHMGATNFKQSSITIKKGQKITLVNDSGSVHIIENGTWEHGSNGQAYQEKPDQESGAPKVDTQITGDSSQTIGPFNTAGTFHLYCVVHPGMNLTVNVK
jgi:plastocyanin